MPVLPQSGQIGVGSFMAVEVDGLKIPRRLRIRSAVRECRRLSVWRDIEQRRASIAGALESAIRQSGSGM
jgi:hypothetical protein